MAHRKTSSQTFRLDVETIEALVAESRREGLSLNALVSHILRDYGVYGQFASRFKVLRLSQPIIFAIFNELSEEAVKNVGASLGIDHPKDMLAALGLPFTFENCVRLLEEFLSRHANWFEAQIGREEEVWRIHLRHGVSPRWSKFLCEYVTAMFDGLGYQKIEPSYCYDYSVTLLFRKRK